MGNFSNLKNDLPSGLVVFLVALPLCLGIALASGAPLFSGIIAGIVGGVIVGVLSGSHTSVSGPAAGLIAIVVPAIKDLGSYEVFLVAIVLAGVFQLIFGLVKAGIVSLYIPSSVIKGMLAAIGILLILKQTPHLLGVDKDAFGEEEYVQSDGNTTFSYLLESIEKVHWGGLLAGLLAFAILILWSRAAIQRNNVLKQIPGALLAVIAATLINMLYKAFFPELIISGPHLVQLPTFNDFEGFKKLFTFPDFSALGNGHVYLIAITIAIVASLESLLSLEAADKLDTLNRKSPQNRELLAQGAGNIFSGLIGGLPITAVIVRSSANISAGAKTKTSAVIHGVLLLVAALLLSPILNQIPLSALAAILILIGYKLAKTSLFVSQYKLGWDQFIPFVVTVLAILFSDLLIGISIGLAVGIFFIIKTNISKLYIIVKGKYKIIYISSQEPNQIQPKIKIKFSEHVSFLNKARLFARLKALPANSIVIIDGSQSVSIDHDVLEMIHNFKEQAKEIGITLYLQDIPDLGIQTDLH
ncbi:MAG: SulP family inorganic anion transporter [Bacteroidetes bacterium]|nr:SulP family inorganic anion transporter [Bacteroidota bacterium]